MGQQGGILLIGFIVVGLFVMLMVVAGRPRDTVSPTPKKVIQPTLDDYQHFIDRHEDPDEVIDSIFNCDEITFQVRYLIYRNAGVTAVFARKMGGNVELPWRLNGYSAYVSPAVRVVERVSRETFDERMRRSR